MPRKPATGKSLYSPEYEHFLVQLRAARVRAGLKQTDAAIRLGRPQSFVSKCESGERRVDVVELGQFCKAYKVTLVRFVQELARKARG